MPKKSAAPFVLSEALLSAFDTNDCIKQYLLDSLRMTRAEPPGGKGRTIAAIVADMHNVRVMWLKAAKGKVPDQLVRTGDPPAMPGDTYTASP